MAAKIIGTGSYFPDNIVTNDYLSTIVDTNDEWIRTRTGILERRISNGEGTALLAAKAAQKALRNAGIEVEEVEYIIVATMSGDHYLPNTASEVQSAIGAVNATCFDINAACSGFVFALNTANAYIQAGFIKTALVIGAETLSRQIDWTDRATCVLFGDGAGAVVLKESEEEKGILSMVTGSNGLKGKVLTCADRNIINPFVVNEFKIDYMKMDGQEVFKFAVKMVPKCIEELLIKANVNKDEIKYFVLHQANKRILEAVAKRLVVDIEAFPMNLDRYGNTSAATIPSLLDEMNQKGMLKRGDKFIISGFGGGLTWGATLIEW